MSHKRALVIDGQLFQSLAYHRGMGKYSLALLEELEKNSEIYEKKVLLLNQNGTEEKDLDYIRNIAPSFKVEFLPFGRSGPGNYRRYSHLEATNKAMLDEYLAKELSDLAVDFFIFSLFQDAEVSTYPTNCAGKYLLVYDLIPLQFPEFYLFDPYTRQVYMSRYKVFYEADHFFTISRTVATDVSVYLGVPRERVTPIYGAQIRRKRIKAKPVEELAGQKFILLPSGDDHRKNNRRAVLAFNEFNKQHGDEYRLVLTSFFNDRTQGELKAYCEQVYFTGNVQESQLSWLYENAELIFFPSEYEGLGLPILEAVEFHKPIVCSNIEVFKEIHDQAFTFCDPYDIQSLKEGLEEVITTKEPKTDSKAYKQILDGYDWVKTAQAVKNIFDQDMYKTEVQQDKQRIAIFAPSPSGFSAIGKVVQEQHYQLSKLVDVDYFLEQGISEGAKTTNMRPNCLQYVATCHNPWKFDEKDLEQYDQVFYHIGNGEYHAATLVKALAYPANVIVHDTDIEGLFRVAKDHGFIDETRYNAEAHLQELIKTVKARFSASLLNKQQCIIVHSSYAAQAIREVLIKNSNTIVCKLNLPTPIPYHVDEPKLTTKITIAMAGIVHQAKGIELAEQIAHLQIPGFTLVLKIFGFSLLSKEAEAALAVLPNVQFIQSPTDTRFLYELSSSDIIVNYRLQYHGETSLSTIEALRLGKTVIVNKSGWFDELPDEILEKVKSRDAVITALERLLAGEDFASKDNQRKRSQYIAEHHTIAAYVAAMLEDQKDGEMA